jgi:hypothetical protein
MCAKLGRVHDRWSLGDDTVSPEVVPQAVQCREGHAAHLR